MLQLMKRWHALETGRRHWEDYFRKSRDFLQPFLSFTNMVTGSLVHVGYIHSSVTKSRHCRTLPPSSMQSGGTSKFHLGEVYHGWRVWWMRSFRSSAVYRHCLQILTAETNEIGKLCNSSFDSWPGLSFVVGTFLECQLSWIQPRTP